MLSPTNYCRCFVLFILLSASFVDATSDELSQNRELRIIGGEAADEGEYPYYVWLQASNGFYSSYCGGSLIAPDIVLTAAHCITDPIELGGDWVFWAYVGALRRDGYNSGGVFRTCDDIIVHPRWTGGVLGGYDLALCKLNEPVLIDESEVRLVLNEDESFPSNGGNLTAIGLGRTDPDRNVYPAKYPELLQEVEVPYVSNDNCRQYQVKDNILCAGRFNASSCAGDSGGPLIQKDLETGIHKQVGIFSFGKTFCGEEPSGTTRVSSHVDWIKSTACYDLDSVGSLCTGVPPPSCDSPELKIDVTTDSFPEETGWKLSVQEGSDFVEVTSVSQHWFEEHTYNYNYNNRVCLEYGKNYKFEMIDTFFRFNNLDSNGCCPQALVETPCGCGNLGKGTCGSFGSVSYTLTLDGTILENSVEASRNLYKSVRVESGTSFTFETRFAVEFSKTTLFSTPADPTAIIDFVRRDDNGNAICEDLPQNIRFNVIFGEDDRDRGEDEDDPDDKKRQNCESVEGKKIRVQERWCNSDARIRGLPDEYEDVLKLKNGSYVKVYNLCPKSCRACADTCEDFNQAFTVEGAGASVNRRCPYLGKRPTSTAARLCRNKIAQLKRGRVKQKPLKEQCAKSCGLVGEGKCAAFLSNSSPTTSPTELPADSSDDDSEPTEAPVDPTEAPVDPTEAPVDPTEAPVDPTEAPVDPTEAPVDPTEAPVDPTEAPVDPTEAPVDPTEAPVDPTDAPVESTDRVTCPGKPDWAYCECPIDCVNAYMKREYCDCQEAEECCAAYTTCFSTTSSTDLP